MNHHLTSMCLAAIGLASLSPAAEPAAPAAGAVNALGLDLLQQATKAGSNTLISPYSIQSALAMTYAGAAGETRAQMAKVLHYPADDQALHASFAAMQQSLEKIAATTAERVKASSQFGGPKDPVIVTVANRLFGQKGYEFRAPFLDLVKDRYAAPFQEMDFVKQFDKERVVINQWVEQQTHDRIQDLIPSGALNEETRLVLVNAIYLKAPWAEQFKPAATKPLPFHFTGGTRADVPTMFRKDSMGYAKRDGYQVLTVPYFGNDLHLLVLLPDDKAGLAALEKQLTPEILAAAASAPRTEVTLYLPKFKLEPPLFSLGKALQNLGMSQAFDKPQGSANFDNMAPRKPNDYLYISEVFHKTFLDLDEKGTEAAAATAVVMARATSAVIEEAKPVEVRVDHPFLFAIQHRSTGACIFLGRLTDPR